MNNLNTIKRSNYEDRIAGIILFSKFPETYHSNNKDLLKKDARIIMANRYKRTTKFDIKNDPFAVSIDWCKTSSYIGKTLWAKVAELLCKEFNQLYIKNKTTKFAIAATMLHPHVSVYNKLHNQFESIRPKDIEHSDWEL